MRLEDPLARLHLGPRPGNAQPAVSSEEEHPHADVVSAAESDALEREADLDDVTLGVDLARALPEPVGRGVFVGALERIHLDAARIDEHVIGNLPGPARVETYADPVVVPHVVAPADRRSDLILSGSAS
jgi:hypothetical protein